MTEKDMEVAKMILNMVPRTTRVIHHSIRFWEFWLWKYRKAEAPVIGIKTAINIMKMVKREYRV